MVEVPELAGKQYGQLRIGAIRGSWTQDLSIDNIYIGELELAGIGSVAAPDNSDLPVEFYNLQGIRVDNPANGIYIRRQGNTAPKVHIKE